MTAEEIANITRLIALVQQGATQLMGLITTLRTQGGETTEQILADAQKANDEAAAIIATLGQ